MVALSKTSGGGVNGRTIMEDLVGELEENATFSGNPFLFASSEASQMVLDRIMPQSVSVVGGNGEDQNPTQNVCEQIL
jgi:hypothetical protein